jgi:hypothetical protein
MPTIARCVIFENTLSLKDKIVFENIALSADKMIAIIACTREQLDFDVWKIIGNSKVIIPINNFPNEAFRNQKWVGAIHYDACY